MVEFFDFKRFYSILEIVRAISLVVEQRSPKPLVGVRFLHRPHKKQKIPYRGFLLTSDFYFFVFGVFDALFTKLV